MRVLIAAVVAGAFAACLGPGAVAAQVGLITELLLAPSGEIHQFGLTPGPDGNLWSADLGCTGLGKCAIVRTTLGDQLTAFRHGLNAGSVPWAIVTGPDGNLWFTDEGRTPAIGRITPNGAITEFSHGLHRGSQPFELALGPDGALWFTDQGHTPAIGRITPNGVITEFSLGLRRGSVPFGIAAAAGKLWFTDHGCAIAGRCAIGEITRHGRITEQTRGLRRRSQPLGIAGGVGGDLWFADASGAIGQITPAGRIAEFSSGLRAGSSPVGVAAGPDGNVWFTDQGVMPSIGQITPRKQIHEYSAGLAVGSEPGHIVPAADGGLWFTDEGPISAVGEVATSAAPALVTTPTLAAPPRRGRRLSCQPGRWRSWARVKPSIGLFSFDGYQWVRDGIAIPGQRQPRYVPSVADVGRRLSCRVTVTYPAPFLVSASATSLPVTVRRPPVDRGPAESEARERESSGGADRFVERRSPGPVPGPRFQMTATTRDLPRSRGQVEDQIHDPDDQRRLYQSPEPIDVKAADDVSREHEHEQRDEEPGHAERKDGQGEGEQPQQRLQQRVQHPEHRGRLEQSRRAADLHAVESRRDHGQHDGVGEPRDTKPNRQRRCVADESSTGHGAEGTFWWRS